MMGGLKPSVNKPRRTLLGSLTNSGSKQSKACPASPSAGCEIISGSLLSRFPSLCHLICFASGEEEGPQRVRGGTLIGAQEGRPPLGWPEPPRWASGAQGVPRQGPSRPGWWGGGASYTGYWHVQHPCGPGAELIQWILSRAQHIWRQCMPCWGGCVRWKPLDGMVVRHLILCYQSADPQFSLDPVIPWFQWV
jgi:hypothetical protein